MATKTRIILKLRLILALCFVTDSLIIIYTVYLQEQMSRSIDVLPVTASRASRGTARRHLLTDLRPNWSSLEPVRSHSAVGCWLCPPPSLLSLLQRVAAAGSQTDMLGGSASPQAWLARRAPIIFRIGSARRVFDHSPSTLSRDLSPTEWAFSGSGYLRRYY